MLQCVLGCFQMFYVETLNYRDAPALICEIWALKILVLVHISKEYQSVQSMTDIKKSLGYKHADVIFIPSATNRKNYWVDLSVCVWINTSWTLICMITSTYTPATLSASTIGHCSLTWNVPSIFYRRYCLTHFYRSEESISKQPLLCTVTFWTGITITACILVRVYLFSH